jgi:hypothetical protein
MLAVIAVVSVLAIFFFPAMQGPYPAVHGPVTALLAVRAANRLRISIMRAGVKAVRSCLNFARLMPFSSSLQRTALASAEFAADSLTAGFNSILRC